MKLSISVPDSQMDLLDRVVQQRGLASRSVAIQQGIDLLLQDALVSDYRDAFSEWDEDGDAAAWQVVASDGLEPETLWW